MRKPETILKHAAARKTKWTADDLFNLMEELTLTADNLEEAENQREVKRGLGGHRNLSAGG